VDGEPDWPNNLSGKGMTIAAFTTPIHLEAFMIFEVCEVHNRKCQQYPKNNGVFKMWFLQWKRKAISMANVKWTTARDSIICAGG